VADQWITWGEEQPLLIYTCPGGARMWVRSPDGHEFIAAQVPPFAGHVFSTPIIIPKGGSYKLEPYEPEEVGSWRI